MRAKIGDWIDQRIGHRAVLASWRAPMAGGASFAHSLGFALGLLFVVQAISGTVLALYYSPSTSSAWASVAYLEDQVTLGAFVRSVHRWGMSAVFIVAGLHLLVTAARGGYRRPREVQWWLAVLILALLVGYSVTGFVLRWDQYGYWATKVEFGYVADGPGGDKLVPLIQGGNEFGNLTLTRMYALHIIVLPAATLALGIALRRLARRHGVVPVVGEAQPAWPHQALRNWIVGALALAGLVAWAIHAGSAGLEGPADPTAAYDARPQWYLRPVFALVGMAGSWRTIAALGAPVLALGALALLPLIDGRADRPRRHAIAMAALVAGLAAAVLLAKHSYDQDASDKGYAERRAQVATQAAQARALARTHGVPVAGGLAVFTTPRFYEARRLWASECASCHDGDDRKAPVIGPGYGGRAHIRAVLVDPSAPEHFGKSPKIATSENAMPKTELPAEDIDALTELIYAETGAADVDPAKVERARPLFDEGPCADCHARAGTDASTGPNLAGYGTRRYWEAMIRDAGEANRFGALDDMPAYDETLTPNQVRALAEYVVWLRTASPADEKALATP